MAEPIPPVDEVVLILLLGVVGAKLAERLRIPRILPLFASGYIVGPDVLGIFDPSVIGVPLSALVFVAIPPILFHEGIRTDIDVLNRVRRTVFLLATVGVLISASFVGLTVFYLFGFPILSAFLVGAILSATDPGVVIGITKFLGIKRRISTVVKAESSFNDATSIVLFTILSSAILGGEISLFGAISEFSRLFFGGMIVGGLISIVASDLLTRLEVEEYATYLSLALFLLTFTVAESLGTSGITAVVISGIIFGRYIKSVGFSVQTRKKVTGLWENIVFLAESIIFLVLGAGFSLSLPLFQLLGAVILALVLILAVRPMTVYLTTLHDRNFNLKEKFFISWVGARGAIPAALAAGAVASGIPQASEIFSIVLVVVLISLVLVSLTSKRIAYVTLDLKMPSPIVDEYFEALARWHSARDILEKLERRHKAGLVDRNLFRSLRSELVKEMEEGEAALEKLRPVEEVKRIAAEQETSLRRELAHARLGSIDDLRLKGIIPQRTYDRLSERIAERLERLTMEEGEGQTPFTIRGLVQSVRRILGLG